MRKFVFNDKFDIDDQEYMDRLEDQLTTVKAQRDELLAACEAMLDQYGIHSHYSIKMAADAIAKAKGEY